MDPIRFSKSEGRGRRALIGGFSYTKHRLSTGGAFTQWYCIRRTTGCKGRIRMSANEETYNVVVNHNHPPSFGETKASTALSDIALQAREEPNTNPLILTQNLLSQVDSETAVALPKEKSLKRKIQRIRRENQPALPKTLEDLGELPANYREINGVDWLLFDNREDNMENRVMLFAGEGVINAMSQSDLWFGDGTFQSVPRIFGQLYVVHYEVEGNVFPGCYALMRNRTGQSYDILFSAIRNLLPDARKDGPAKFSSDFELATTNSFLSVFPRASGSYCFFHFAQSLWRRAQHLELLSTINGKSNKNVDPSSTPVLLWPLYHLSMSLMHSRIFGRPLIIDLTIS